MLLHGTMRFNLSILLLSQENICLLGGAVNSLVEGDDQQGGIIPQDRYIICSAIQVLHKMERKHVELP